MEGTQRIRMEQLRDGETSVTGRAAEFFVDEGVVKAGGGSIGGGGGVEDTVRASPVDRAEAHGARFAGRVEIAAGQLETAEDAAGLANGLDFSVGGRVVGGGNAVGAFGDDLAVLNDQSGEGATVAGVHIFDGEGDGALQEWFGHGRESPALQSAAEEEDSQCG